MEESPTYGLFSESGYGYPPLTLFARRAYGPSALNGAGRGVRVEEEEGGGIPCPAWMLSRVSPRRGCD